MERIRALSMYPFIVSIYQAIIIYGVLLSLVTANHGNQAINFIAASVIWLMVPVYVVIAFRWLHSPITSSRRLYDLLVAWYHLMGAVGFSIWLIHRPEFDALNDPSIADYYQVYITRFLFTSTLASCTMGGPNLLVPTSVVGSVWLMATCVGGLFLLLQTTFRILVPPKRKLEERYSQGTPPPGTRGMPPRPLGWSIKKANH